jgi:hypothetical protein
MQLPMPSVYAFLDMEATMSKNEEHERTAELCGFGIRISGEQTIRIDFRTKEERPATGGEASRIQISCLC